MERLATAPEMRKLLIIGIGAGDPDYVTMQAVKALNRVDVFFVFDKGEAKSGLVELRDEVCRRFITTKSYRVVAIDDPKRQVPQEGYKAGVEDWHRERARLLAEAIEREVGKNGCGAILVIGDPSLYDSTIRIVDRVVGDYAVELDVEVIPGISSVQALAARHRIMLNEIGEDVRLTTGRNLASQMPASGESVVVMLDGGPGLDAIQNDSGLEIYWGACLGMPDEIVRGGTSSEVYSDIARLRTEMKKTRGWIMDVFLLRRRKPE